MFKRLITYILCACMGAHPAVVEASNTEVNVLHVSKVYTAQSNNQPVKCIDIKQSASGAFRLSFDPSLHEEGMSLLLVHDQKGIAEVAFKQGQLGFWGLGKRLFQLECTADYICPKFYGEAESLSLAGTFAAKSSISVRAINLMLDVLMTAPISLSGRFKKWSVL